MLGAGGLGPVGGPRGPVGGEVSGPVGAARDPPGPVGGGRVGGMSSARGADGGGLVGGRSWSFISTSRSVGCVSCSRVGCADSVGHSLGGMSRSFGGISLSLGGNSLSRAGNSRSLGGKPLSRGGSSRLLGGIPESFGGNSRSLGGGDSFRLDDAGSGDLAGGGRIGGSSRIEGLICRSSELFPISLLGCIGGDDLREVVADSRPELSAGACSNLRGDGERRLQSSTVRGSTLLT